MDFSKFWLGSSEGGSDAFKDLFKRNGLRPTQFETMYRPKWMLTESMSDSEDSDIETEFALAKIRHKREEHESKPSLANYFCPQCNIVDVKGHAQKKRLDKFNQRAYDLNALAQTDPVRSEMRTVTSSFHQEKHGRPQAEQRQSTWGETWWADMPTEPPVGETLFQERVQSVEMTRIMQPNHPINGLGLDQIPHGSRYATARPPSHLTVEELRHKNLMPILQPADTKSHRSRVTSKSKRSQTEPQYTRGFWSFVQHGEFPPPKRPGLHDYSDVEDGDTDVTEVPSAATPEPAPQSSKRSGDEAYPTPEKTPKRSRRTK